VIRLVIAAYGEDRSIAPNDTLGSFESLKFGSFNIHFDQRDAFASEGVIKADARNLSVGSTGNPASSNTIPSEVNDTVLITDCGFMQYRSGADVAHKSLKAGHHRGVSLEGNNFAKAIIGLGNEGLDRVSGVGPTIDKTLVGR